MEFNYKISTYKNIGMYCNVSAYMITPFNIPVHNQIYIIDDMYMRVPGTRTRESKAQEVLMSSNAVDIKSGRPSFNVRRFKTCKTEYQEYFYLLQCSTFFFTFDVYYTYGSHRKQWKTHDMYVSWR